MTTSNILRMLRRFIAISRPLGYLPILSAFVAGLFLNSKGNFVTASSLLGALFVTFPMGLVVYGMNDIADRESDAKNPRKGGMYGARLVRRETRPLVVAMAITIIVSVLACVLLERVGMGLALLGVYVLGYMYSIKPIRLKNRPVLDSLSNGLWAIGIFLMGYWANVDNASLHLPAWKLLAVIMLFVGALHALAAVLDHDVDKSVGDTTIAVALGKTKTTVLCALAFLACLPLIHGRSLGVDGYVLVAAGLTLSTLRHQSAKYIRTITLAIILLLPVVIGISWLIPL